jgi:hypothetical protein
VSARRLPPVMCRRSGAAAYKAVPSARRATTRISPSSSPGGCVMRSAVQFDAMVAADDEDAKQLVLELVRSVGLRPIDAEPLVRARELEALGWLNITLQATLGNTWRTAWKLLGVPQAA